MAAALTATEPHARVNEPRLAHAAVNSGAITGEAKPCRHGRFKPACAARHHRACPSPPSFATPASAQLLQRKDLSLSVAQTMANGALEACKAMGYAASVVVVDRGGDTLVALRGDGTGPHTVENARRKAYTANTFKMSTEDFIQAMKTQPTRREQTTLPGVIAINGGVPIKVGNDVIGGIGLSGSPGKDEECVNAGLEKVKQFLQ